MGGEAVTAGNMGQAKQKEGYMNRETCVYEFIDVDDGDHSVGIDPSTSRISVIFHDPTELSDEEEKELAALLGRFVSGNVEIYREYMAGLKNDAVADALYTAELRRLRSSIEGRLNPIEEEKDHD